MFPIRKVDQAQAEDIEYLGTKRKFWFTSDGQRYLFRPKSAELVKIGESGFYLTPRDDKTMFALDVFRKFAEREEATARIWLGKLKEIGHNAVDAILAEVPPQRMSPITREFTLELLKINQRRLLEGFAL